MKENQNTKENYYENRIDSTFNQAFSAASGNGRVIQEHKYCSKKAGAIAIFFTLDIGDSLLDIGYSNY